VANIIYFKAKEELTAEKNLNEFIAHCRDKLSLYEDQGGWKANRWYNNSRAGKRICISFSRYSAKTQSGSIPVDQMDEPFISFAKAYIRYDQSQKIVSNMLGRLSALRALHDALVQVHGAADVLKTEGIVILKSVELISQRYNSIDGKHKTGLALKNILDFIREKKFVPYLQDWVPPWKKAYAKAGRTDAESLKWQETRCPSLHHMYSLADCFSNAKAPEDRFWSSVLVFLMFAPGRAGELADLTVDCLHKSENGSLGVRWYGEKGFGYTIKWVPKDLENVVIEAHKRLVELGQPARDSAKFAYETPGVFMRHDDCATPDSFPEDKPLNAYEFGMAMGFSVKSINRIVGNCKDFNGKAAWRILHGNGKWIKEKCTEEAWSYKGLASYVLNKYANKKWPNMPSIDRPIWESLILSRSCEFLSRNKMKNFSWCQLTINDLNSQIASTKHRKVPIDTLFQRMGYQDEDGSEIHFTTHQIRVWLSTNAECQGMDAWQLAQWAGRARINDNYHYDLRTPKEREENHRAILELKQRPTLLEALKLNLPISYEDLGINQSGIADVTEYGMCVHDYTMAPCTKGGECMICREHVCIKGMPKTLDKIKHFECMVESQFNKAKTDADDLAFGADRWVTHLGWKLAHVRTQRERLESEDISDGTILRISPKHDPSVIERALSQRGDTIEIDADKVDATLISGLLALDNK